MNIYFISPASISFPSYGLLRRLLRYTTGWIRRGSVSVCHFELRAYLPEFKAPELSRPINFTARPLLIGPAARPLLCHNPLRDPFKKIHYSKDFINEINTPSLFYFTHIYSYRTSPHVICMKRLDVRPLQWHFRNNTM